MRKGTDPNRVAEESGDVPGVVKTSDFKPVA
jgi:hypothetical protein